MPTSISAGTGSAVRSRCRPSERGGRAFTAVELLVAVLVVGVLAALALPALVGVRQRAHEGGSLANLRQIALVTATYADAERAYMFGRTGWVRPMEHPYAFVLGFDVWRLEENWPTLFHAYAPWPEHFRTWISPRGNPEPWVELMAGPGTLGAVPTSYRYSNSFVAQPGVWSQTDTADPASLVRAVRPHQVRFPASKVIFFDLDRPYLREPGRDAPRPVLMVDGSARAVRDRDATRPVANRASPESLTPPRYYHDTPGGVWGRDFE